MAISHDWLRAVVPVGLALLAGTAGAAPRVASMNLCADQLVLQLADPAQILSLSWLAADPDESLLAQQARAFPLNHGTAEELLRLRPDVVLAGAYTATHARALLRRLGIAVVELAPADTLEDIETNVRRVAAAIEQPARGAALLARMRDQRARLVAARPAIAVTAVVLRPGLFTVGEDSLMTALMHLAGLRNIAAEQGLDRWGSLSIESLLAATPQLLIVNAYRPADASLANSALAHPALREIGARVPVLHLPGPESSCGLPQSLDTAARLQRAALLHTP